MIRVRTTPTRVGPLEWEGHRFDLVGSETSLRVRTPWFALRAVYHRPVRIETVGTDRATFAIRDLVMLARIAAVGLPLAIFCGRRLR